jgi:hypothetical protein
MSLIFPFYPATVHKFKINTDEIYSLLCDYKTLFISVFSLDFVFLLYRFRFFPLDFVFLLRSCERRMTDSIGALSRTFEKGWFTLTGFYNYYHNVSIIIYY